MIVCSVKIFVNWFLFKDSSVIVLYRSTSLVALAISNIIAMFGFLILILVRGLSLISVVSSHKDGFLIRHLLLTPTSPYMEGKPLSPSTDIFLFS